jgi:hypothetical protein
MGLKRDDRNYEIYSMPMREKEKIQYITFESIKGNFHKVFGKANDTVAEILFRYASECTNDSINY